MKALDFWKAVAVDEAGLLEQLVEMLRDRSVRYCVVGGQAVNAYVEPLVSLDLDLAVATDDLALVEALVRERFRVERFPHSLNLSMPGSDLRVQIQTDPRYAEYVDRAEILPVLGLRLPVARVEDVLQGKIWAAQDPARRASKRQKDLADISRLLETDPQLRSRVPDELLKRLI